jgi:PEP-CTERM motif
VFFVVKRISSNCWAVFTLVVLAAFHCAGQGVVWTGPTISFTNNSVSDVDVLTANVWLTRGSSQGLFNSRYETGYTRLFSPADTEWAYGQLADYASLSYANWETWNGQKPLTMLGQNAVLHLITDDIYLAIRFTSWGQRTGGFSYDRSTSAAVPEPSTIAVFAGGLLALVALRRK